MRIDREYHHFKGGHLTRAEWIERFVVDELVHTDVPDDVRESSQAWELMHSSTCKAFMHVLAEKRGVDVELARVAGALHDYYVVKTGKYGNHAQLGAPLVRDILANHGGFSDEEIRLVYEMVANHSDKHIYSDSPHIELVKDADVFDCSLYYGTEFYYLTRKPLPVCHEYFVRVLKVREELGMPLPVSYRCLARQESGGLRDLNIPVPTGEGAAPTTVMLALWALATSAEARDWPLIVAWNQGGVVQWFGPQKVGDFNGDQGIPDWRRIREIRRAVFEQLEGNIVSARNGDIRELLERSRRGFIPAWTGQRGAFGVRERTAVALRDFECDPKADGKLADLINSRVLSKLEGSTVREANSGSGWDLSPMQAAAVDELARVKALTSLRGELIRRLQGDLEVVSRRLGCDVLNQFPSGVFGCEESPRVEAPNQAWLAVAWPRFNRFEFVVGDEAHDRFAALVKYFKDTDTRQ